MKRIAIIVTALLLVGCACKQPALPGTNTQTDSSPATGKPIDRVKEKVDIDPYLLKECDWFQPMTVKNPTPNQVLEQKASDVATLRECAKRHSSLAKIVKDAFNVK
jgi:hypothetical protein